MKTAHSSLRCYGFSLIELLVICAILAIVAAVSIPAMMTAKHGIALQGTGKDLGSFLEQARTHAIKDNHFYALYVISGPAGSPSNAFIDVYPQSATGFSGNHNGTVDPKDPVMFIPAEVSQQPASAAPATADLKSQWLPSGSSITPIDAYSGTTPTTTPFFFGPDGLPCTPSSGGATCRGNMIQTAYWIFLQDSHTQDWIAVTVTPAGRIRQWIYRSSTWMPY